MKILLANVKLMKISKYEVWSSMQNKFNKRAFLKEKISSKQKVLRDYGRIGFNMNKKAGTPIDITLLVFMALCLAGGTLLIFYLHSGYVSSSISDSRFLDETYIKESKIDFYINDIMDKAIVKITDKNNPLPEFLTGFKNELGKYKVNGSYLFFELAQLENQTTLDNVEFTYGKIVFLARVNLMQDYNKKFIVNYNYDKKFEKRID